MQWKRKKNTNKLVQCKRENYSPLSRWWIRSDMLQLSKSVHHWSKCRKALAVRAQVALVTSASSALCSETLSSIRRRLNFSLKMLVKKQKAIYSDSTQEFTPSMQPSTISRFSDWDSCANRSNHLPTLTLQSYTHHSAPQQYLRSFQQRRTVKILESSNKFWTLLRKHNFKKKTTSMAVVILPQISAVYRTFCSKTSCTPKRPVTSGWQK